MYNCPRIVNNYPDLAMDTPRYTFFNPAPLLETLCVEGVAPDRHDYVAHGVHIPGDFLAKSAPVLRKVNFRHILIDWDSMNFMHSAVHLVIHQGVVFGSAIDMAVMLSKLHNLKYLSIFTELECDPSTFDQNHHIHLDNLQSLYLCIDEFWLGVLLRALKTSSLRKLRLEYFN
jgi:hypothetical protein